ncbi:MAG: T9SS type A sorting domain-containing protein [Rhodothermales bacterium]
MLIPDLVRSFTKDVVLYKVLGVVLICFFLAGFAAPDYSLIHTGASIPSHQDPLFYSLADTNKTRALPKKIFLKQPAADDQAISFGVSTVAGHSLTQPTSLQFGPDGKLYALRKKGNVHVITLSRLEANAYEVTDEQNLSVIRSIPNHDDDGRLNTDEKLRQATGLVVGGTPANPVVYVSSSDPRVGGHDGNPDTGLDTNSGVISRLTWIGMDREDPAGYWEHVELVRGLPRSEENHANNGMQLSLDEMTLFVAVGGMTNAGAPSNNFAYINEYALAAAILSIDLHTINALPTLVDFEGRSYKYTLPTLDDPERANANGIDDPLAGGYDGVDFDDPWGGNDGLNQAKIVSGGPVQVYSGGYRNAYDVLITRTEGREGRMYTIDNGPNRGWGGHPLGEGSYPGETAGQCTNDYDPAELGSSIPGPNDGTVLNKNGLHFVRELIEGETNFAGDSARYYAGHPTPIRGNPAGAGLYTGDFNADSLLNTGVWRDGSNPSFPLPADWPPVPVEEADPAECDFRNAAVNDGALIAYDISTNGLAEYTASNFDNALKGNLLGVGYNDNAVYRMVLNEEGDEVVNGEEIFAENFGKVSLDITTLGDDTIFPGTIWVTGFNEHEIYVFEPADFDNEVQPECSGLTDPLLDEDLDGYTNEDELLNAADPCSAASTPADFDGDLLSDLSDPDDDNDTVPDVVDPFVLDASNGLETTLPIDYPLLNENPATGFFGLGFTGLMSNGVDDYLDLYTSANLIPGGTAGLFTISEVGAGGVMEVDNTQENAFQFGVYVDEDTDPFTIKVRMAGPFFNGQTPVAGQSQGIFLGTGEMDNYVKLVVGIEEGAGGVFVEQEENGQIISTGFYRVDGILNASSIDLYFDAITSTGTVQPAASMAGGSPQYLGNPLLLSSNLLNALQGSYEVLPDMPSALAVGIIATTGNTGVSFNATWDAIDIYTTPALASFGSAVSEGWNMVGLPVIPVDSDYTRVFDDVSPAYTPFYWTGAAYEAEENVTTSRGYWIFAPTPADFVYTGTLVEQVSVNVRAGWNMIAGPSCDIGVVDVQDPESLLIPGTLYAYANGYSLAQSIDKGKGYWVNAVNEGIITLACPATGKKGPKAARERRRSIQHHEQGYGVLHLTDAAGQHQSLMFGGAALDPEQITQYAMPPLAPAGSFDVRFSNHSRIAPGPLAHIRLQGVVLPAVLKVVELPAGSDEKIGVQLRREGASGASHADVRVVALSTNEELVLQDEDIIAMSISSITADEEAPPVSFELVGNYPNPFNPHTRIVFDLPAPADIKVTLHDVLGREVLEVNKSAVSAGKKRWISIDGASLATGSYLYRLTAKTESGTAHRFGRMLLVK